MIQTEIKGIAFEFKSANELFSPRNIDKGTLAMMSVIEFETNDKVLDLGCGYGVVGILAAKIIGTENVVMVDNDDIAIHAATENAVLNEVPNIKIIVSNGFSHIHDTGFTKIISHPPYHVDFSVPKMFIEKGFNRLSIGGRLYMVTKRKDWYMKKLTSIFGGVRIWEIDGYYVFMAMKKSDAYANVDKKQKKDKNVKISTPIRKRKIKR